MISEHQEEFDKFRDIHAKYQLSSNSHQQEFNEFGKEILEIIREYEQRLCGGMERGQFGKFSDKVSEKFWSRIKKDFPLIELVGVEIINP